MATEASEKHSLWELTNESMFTFFHTLGEPLEEVPKLGKWYAPIGIALDSVPLIRDLSSGAPAATIEMDVAKFIGMTGGAVMGGGVTFLMSGNPVYAGASAVAVGNAFKLGMAKLLEGARAEWGTDVLTFAMRDRLLEAIDQGVEALSHGLASCDSPLVQALLDSAIQSSSLALQTITSAISNSVSNAEGSTTYVLTRSGMTTTVTVDDDGNSTGETSYIDGTRTQFTQTPSGTTIVTTYVDGTSATSFLAPDLATEEFRYAADGTVTFHSTRDKDGAGSDWQLNDNNTKTTDYFGTGNVDIFRFNAGDGHAVVNGNGGADVLQFNANGDAPVVSHEGKDLVLSYDGDEIIFKDWYSDALDQSPRVDRIELLASNADGTAQVDANGDPVILGIISGATLTALGLKKVLPAGEHTLLGDLDHYQETLIGGAGDDFIFSSSSFDNIQGGDILDGGQGGDQLYGCTGSDRVILRAGDGMDSFLGHGGADIIELRGLQLTGPDTRLDVSGDDLILSFGGGTQLTLVGWKTNPDQNLVVVQEQGGPMYSSEQVAGLVKGFIGTASGETLTGNSLGNDVIGLGGADILNGGLGNDTLTGGSDDDIDHLYGGAGFDTYNVSNNDVINDSDDSGQVLVDGVLVTGGALVDVGTGGAVHYRSADSFIEYFHDVNAHTLQVTSGASSVTLENFNPTLSTANGVTTNHSGLGIDLTRSATPDLVILTEGVDTPTPMSVASEVYALGGNDTVTGSAYADNIFGGAGSDVLNGSAGDDTLTGGVDNDVDYLHGGAGLDTYNVSAGDVISDSDGSGRIFFSGHQLTGGTYIEEFGGALLTFVNANDDVFCWDLTTDQLRLIVGSDIAYVDNFTATLADPSAVTLHSGLGIDLVRTHDVPLVLLGSGADNVTLSAPAEVHDLGGNDDINGSGGNDFIFGWWGDDVLHGNAGDDLLDGGPGADTVHGGAGNDIIQSGCEYSLRDYLYGEAGYDTYYAWNNDVIRDSDMNGTIYFDSFQLSPGFYVETTLAGAQRFLGPHSEEYLYDREAQTLVVNQPFNTIWQDGSVTWGVDTLTVEGFAPNFSSWPSGSQFWGLGVALTRSGGSLVLMTNLNYSAPSSMAVEVHGTTGNNSITGSTQDDILFGGAGRDNLNGGAGNDRLYGGVDVDTLTGGAGDDYLVGGLGGDTYIFSTGSYDHDTIVESGLDFDTARFSSSANLTFFRSGNDLEISTSPTDLVTVQDWFLGQEHQVEVVLVGSTSFTAAQITGMAH